MRDTTPLATTAVSVAMDYTAFPLTDMGNAEAFAARYGAEVRYDHRRKQYVIWSSPVWTPDVDGGVQRRAKALVRARYLQAADIADLKMRENHAKWAIKSESRDRQAALLALAQSEEGIAEAGNGWDAHPFLFACANGVINLETSELRTADPNDRLTLHSPIAYDPQAQCPRWERFLGEIVGDNPDVVAYLHKLVGYMLTGDTSEQVVHVGVGTGANGKSTFTNVLRHVMGTHALVAPFSTFELHGHGGIANDLAALVGRRFVVAAEANEGTRLDEARLKSLTGGEEISARFLFGEYFTFRPAAKLWLSVNHRPVVRDDSHGFWRRVRVVPFPRTFDIDTTLETTLMAEATGILAWAVRGCLLWQAEGLRPPDCVRLASAAYEAESDPLRDFIATACNTADETAETRASDLYTAYKRWAEREGLQPREVLTSTKFGRRMGDRFRKHSTARGHVYEGISVRPLEG